MHQVGGSLERVPDLLELVPMVRKLGHSHGAALEVDVLPGAAAFARHRGPEEARPDAADGVKSCLSPRACGKVMLLCGALRHAVTNVLALPNQRSESGLQQNSTIAHVGATVLAEAAPGGAKIPRAADRDAATAVWVEVEPFALLPEADMDFAFSVSSLR